MSSRHRASPSSLPQCEYFGVVGRAVTLNRVPMDSLPPRPKNCLRFVVISDTHERHREFTLPPGDVLLHCGDILYCDPLSAPSHIEHMLSDFFEWFNLHPHPVKIFIAGNHDCTLQKMGVAAVREMAAPAIYLCEDSVVLEPFGLRVYGSPRSTANSEESVNKAFQSLSAWKPICFDRSRLTKSKEQKSAAISDAPFYARMETLPREPIDVLITHQSLSRNDRKRRFIFDKTMLRFLRKIEQMPRLHLCGHLHSEHGLCFLNEDGESMPSINASSLRTAKGKRNCPCVVDVTVPDRA